MRDVEVLLRDLVTPRKNAPDTWYRYNTASILGAALTAERKYAEAERLLIDGYQGLVERKATIPSSTVDPLDRAQAWLVQLYQAGKAGTRRGMEHPRLRRPLTAQRNGRQSADRSCCFKNSRAVCSSRFTVRSLNCKTCAISATGLPAK